MAKEFQKEKVMNLTYERKTILTQECQGTAGIQHRECSFGEEGPVTLLLFAHLFSGYWCGDFLLHCWTVFHCHHDFIIAVPSTSTNVLKSQHILEFNGAKLSTEGQNRNNDMESFWARTMWYKTPDYLLPYAKGFEMNNVQTEPKHQIHEQLLVKKWKTNFSTT